MRFILLLLCLFTPFVSKADNQELENKKSQLGKLLFFDTILSKNKTQACATCHNPQKAFIDDRDNDIYGMVSLGDDGKSLGTRNTPTLTYAKFSPYFYYDKLKQQWKGGQFYDGREKNLANQAGKPILDKNEMQMENQEMVVNRLKQHSLYSKLFKEIFGKNIFENSKKTYLAMSESIASFEKEQEFATFDSKYDRYLKGEYEFTELEELGYSLFFSNNNTNCSICHQLQKQLDSANETFSNYEYHNIGVPTNPLLKNKTDYGLFHNTMVKSEKQKGKFKVPTLRNIAITAPYMHNGVFKNLFTVLVFYDKYLNKNRDTNPETHQKWQEAEVKSNINLTDLRQGKPLTNRKIEAIIAFLETLTDKRYEHLLK